MRNLILLSCVLVLWVTACAQPKVGVSDPSAAKQPDAQPVPGEKCEHAKDELSKVVEEGQTSNLRELKRNIELHCVWRRD